MYITKQTTVTDAECKCNSDSPSSEYFSMFDVKTKKQKKYFLKYTKLVLDMTKSNSNKSNKHINKKRAFLLWIYDTLCGNQNFSGGCVLKCWSQSESLLLLLLLLLEDLPQCPCLCHLCAFFIFFLIFLLTLCPAAPITIAVNPPANAPVMWFIPPWR